MTADLAITDFRRMTHTGNIMYTRIVYIIIILCTYITSRGAVDFVRVLHTQYAFRAKLCVFRGYIYAGLKGGGGMEDRGNGTRPLEKEFAVTFH